jgi:acetyl esterase/lipase
MRRSFRLTDIALGAAILVLLLLVLLWGFAHFYLRGRDLSAYDEPAGRSFSRGAAPSAEHDAVVASLGVMKGLLRGVPPREHVGVLRRHMDELFSSGDLDAAFIPVDAGGVAAEWVLAPGADDAKRLLYIHGGAFAMGSPRSHRRLTAKFSEITGGAVLAIDYRLMPEHPRRAGIDDCRRAYRWLLDNGVQGRAPAAKLWVAGDSAGGNLALSLIAWVRDRGLRAPNAAVALSPLTDATLSSPSLRNNVRSDPMLGPLFGQLAKVPAPLLLWRGWLQMRIRPCDPVVSPARGNLSRLPPVLVQVSTSEMLCDDARRYANRAIEAGSPVQLQTWDHMVHVWQIYHPELPEGREAIEEIRRFLAAT